MKSTRGLLALLSLATPHGCNVDGQREEIEYLTASFDQQRQETADGPRWPQ